MTSNEHQIAGPKSRVLEMRASAAAAAVAAALLNRALLMDCRRRKFRPHPRMIRCFYLVRMIAEPNPGHVRDFARYRKNRKRRAAPSHTRAHIHTHMQFSMLDERRSSRDFVSAICKIL